MTRQVADAELLRLRSLFALDLVDAEGQRFDRIGRIAAQTFGVPIALVTVLDDDHQWFCAAVGTDLDGNARSESFCTRLIDLHESLLVVEDTDHDDRFADLPIVAGEPHIRFYAGAAVSTPDGQRIGTLCILDVEPHGFDASQRQTLRDLADLVESEVHHLRLAMTDDLTGLPNRRAFMAAARRYLAMGERRGEPVTLVFGDVDGLKSVNDEFGHGAGDELLCRAADVMSAAVRPIDLVARIGGDEFALVMYGMGDEEAATALERIRDLVVASNDSVVGPALAMSFGLATSTSGRSLEELVDRADDAMYDTRRDRYPDVERPPRLD
jgi:diguanylate cyclase (GGDEF)-like protein